MDKIFSIITKIFSESQFWATFIGIIVAAVIGNFYWIQQHKKQLKRDLELDFFKRLNEVISELMIALINVQSDYYTILGSLRMHIKNPKIFSFNPLEEHRKMYNNQNELGNKIRLFFLHVEGNEIIVYKFMHYKKFFTYRMDDLSILSYDCMNDLINPNSRLTTEEGYSKFEIKCKALRDRYLSYTAYLQDYRNELMEYFMFDLFMKRIPKRVPLDPTFKPLKEIATMEAVEKEEKQRNKDLSEDKTTP